MPSGSTLADAVQDLKRASWDQEKRLADIDNSMSKVGDVAELLSTMIDEISDLTSAIKELSERIEKNNAVRK